MLKRFFRQDPGHVRLWFGHFSMNGMADFTHGAHALARYALLNRDEVCLLSWNRPKLRADERTSGAWTSFIEPMSLVEARFADALSCVQVWRLLVWAGKHPQAPVAVAQKTRKWYPAPGSR